MIELFLALCVQQYQFNWDNTPNQIWTGESWHANRLQDWQVNNHRVECLETGEKLPVRTMHCLPIFIDGYFDLNLKTGSIESNPQPNENSWSGVLIGAGSKDINRKLTALTHHVPAENGGYLAGIDHKGKVFLRDFTSSIGPTPLWSINTKIGPDDLKLIEPYYTDGNGFKEAVMRPVTLSVKYKSLSQNHLDADALIITANDAENGSLVSSASYMFFDEAVFEGGFALASHHGPTNSSHGHWFDDVEIQGDGVKYQEDDLYGPVLSTLYTVSEDTLKMTVQFPPIHSDHQAQLKTYHGIQLADIDPLSRTASFKIEDWDTTQALPFEASLTNSDRVYSGTIRKEPLDTESIEIAALTCHKTYTGGLKWNENGLWFPHADTTDALKSKNPDMVYFSGDQIYEGDLTPAWQKSEDAYMLDYLYKWYHWCWAFHDLTRHAPTVVIPDDHDVYHGNLWGAGERPKRKIEDLTSQDQGGYKHKPSFVNAVHRTQTSHLPDPVDGEPDANGNSVYFTRLIYGGLDIAIIGDRQFKESPAVAVPEGDVYNGWFRAEGFNPATDADRDVPLLGARQEAFMSEWAKTTPEKTWLKLFFSQTPFVCLQTLPAGSKGGKQPGLKIHPLGEGALNDVPVADADSNGWPQSARNRAVSMLQQAGALHVAGDQHLGYVAQYAVNEHGDGTYVFCTPAIANTWPRRWMPKDKEVTGHHVDGFGNKVTVHAVSNPHQYQQEPAALHDRAPGWGYILCDPINRTVTIEAWPRFAEPNADDSLQYDGWPIVLEEMGNKN
ncbi:MAG: hypothetical protein CMJ38_07285 [Phycisphaerae bacterium]|nr:hypothetical protein [Phycisphaerae bacterium]